MSYKWPKHIPSNCPPDEAVPAAGLVYRLVRHNPPEPGDFQSWRDEAGRDPRDADKSLLCRSFAMSVYSTLSSARRRLRLFKPRLNKEPFVAIAAGTLRPDIGVMLETGSQDHISLWVQLGRHPHRLFSKIVHKEKRT